MMLNKLHKIIFDVLQNFSVSGNMFGYCRKTPLTEQMEPPLKSVQRYLARRKLSAEWHPTQQKAVIRPLLKQ
jgi:hypothetical protein